MLEFEYNGIKTVLVTSEDIFKIQNKFRGTKNLYSENDYWKLHLALLKKSGVKAVMVISSMSIDGFPTVLRDAVELSDKKVYVGSLT